MKGYYRVLNFPALFSHLFRGNSFIIGLLISRWVLLSSFEANIQIKKWMKQAPVHTAYAVDPLGYKQKDCLSWFCNLCHPWERFRNLNEVLLLITYLLRIYTALNQNFYKIWAFQHDKFLCTTVLSRLVRTRTIKLTSFPWAY